LESRLELALKEATGIRDEKNCYSTSGLLRRFRQLVEIGNNNSIASNTFPNLHSLNFYFCLALGDRRYRNHKHSELREIQRRKHN
jgi:hypothetical protein